MPFLWTDELDARVARERRTLPRDYVCWWEFLLIAGGAWTLVAIGWLL